MFNLDFLKKRVCAVFDGIFLKQCVLCRDVLNIRNCVTDPPYDCYLCDKCRLEVLPIDQNNCCKRCGYPFEPLRVYNGKIVCGKNIFNKKNIICQSCQSMCFFFKNARSCFQYRSKIRKLLLDFKFYFQTEPIDFIGCAMFGVYEHMKKADIVCCIPIDRKKLFIKGYNHAVLIANGFFKFAKQSNHDIVFLPDLLIKKHSQSGQSKHMSQHERLLKTHNFSINQKYFTSKWCNFFSGKTILVIDDIMTTGSTLNAAAFVLKQNFFNVEIECLTFARTMLY